MKDWINKLDDFLKITDREILTHAGKVSRELADAKAKSEFSKFKKLHREELSPVEKEFIKSIDEAEKKLLNKGK